MSASAALIDTLKRELKAQGATYAAVARALGMSEASVKRMFSREAMLVRLRRVANEFADLHNDDTRRPFEECTAMHMLVAIRPWELSKFAEMQRRK